MARELAMRSLTAKRVVNEVLILMVGVVLFRSVLTAERFIRLLFAGGDVVDG